MTLDEAIKHANHIAVFQDLQGCKECAADHLELALWLEELKRHREAWQKVRKELKEEMTGLDMFVEREHTIRWCLRVIDEALGEVGEQDG